MAYVTTATGGAFYYLNIEENGDLLDAQIALDAMNLSGGMGATVVITARHLHLSGTLRIPDRVILTGSGPRSTIINGTGTGAMFEFDSLTHAGLCDMRLGLGGDGSQIGIDIKTTEGSCRQLHFRNLEIAGIDVSGQTGIRSITSNSQIISECSFDRIVLVQVDRPIIENGPEGNFWTDISIDQFARDGTDRAAIDATTHASFYSARVAGTVAADSIAYQQKGNRNIANIVADIGAQCTALNIEGQGNVTTLERPERLTPAGHAADNNTIVDGDGMTVGRCAFKGTATTAARFALSGFGSTATVTDVKGCDQRVKFTINASGTGQTPYPTVGYWFIDGDWPTDEPIIQVTRDGGNQNDKNGFGTSALADRWGFTFGATPIAGESYAFIVTVG